MPERGQVEGMLSLRLSVCYPHAPLQKYSSRYSIDRFPARRTFDTIEKPNHQGHAIYDAELCCACVLS